MLDQLDNWIDNIPLDTRTQRFGNRAFRDWGARLELVRLADLKLPAYTLTLDNSARVSYTKHGCPSRMQLYDQSSSTTSTTLSVTGRASTMARDMSCRFSATSPCCDTLAS